MTVQTFKTRNLAIAAARAALDANAIPTVDFEIIKTGPKAWEWKTKKAFWNPESAAVDVETAEVVDGLPNVTLTLATEDFDIGPVLAENARAVAQEEANSYGIPVSIRNELTDEVIEVVQPTPSPEDAPPFELPVETEFLILATEDEDLGTVPAAGALLDAQSYAKDIGAAVSIRHPVTGEVIEVVQPTTSLKGEPEGEVETTEEAAPVEESFPERNFKEEMRLLQKSHKLMMKDLLASQKHEIRELEAEMKAAAKAAKPAKSSTTKGQATRAARAVVDGVTLKGPEGKTAQCIELAKRPEGVTVAELIALTGWTKAPWSWNFTNPKGNGWAQKFGYKFHSVKGEDRKVRYFLTTK